jgi:hypothetical protein
MNNEQDGHQRSSEILRPRSAGSACVACEGSRRLETQGRNRTGSDRSLCRPGSRCKVADTAMCEASGRRWRGAAFPPSTLVSEESRPPSNAAVTCLRETDGKRKLSWLSCVMAGYARSTLCSEIPRQPKKGNASNGYACRVRWPITLVPKMNE